MVNIQNIAGRSNHGAKSTLAKVVMYPTSTEDRGLFNIMVQGDNRALKLPTNGLASRQLSELSEQEVKRPPG